MPNLRAIAVGFAAQFCALLALAGQAQTAPQAADPPPSGPAVAVLRNGFSLRCDHREVRGDSTRLYLGPGQENFVDVATAEITRIETELLPPPAAVPAPASLSLDHAVSQASGLHQIDPDLIRSVIRAESGFHARARSPKGAQGLMQLMPLTASRLGVSDPYDPVANVDGGTRYLRQLLFVYNNDLAKALAAYNAGPARVDQYGGVPPYHETRAYVARVINDFNRTKLAARKSAQPARKAASRGGAAKAAASAVSPPRRPS